MARHAEAESETTKRGALAVMLAGRSDRLALEVAALLAQELPRIGGPAFDKAVQMLRARFPAQVAGAMLNDFVLLLSEMAHSARLPRLRAGRPRAANKDEVFFVAMLAALQRGDKGRAIGVILSAQALARRLAEHGVIVARMRPELFDAVAGYPVAETPNARPPAPEPVRPTLTLLQSA